MPSVDCGFDQHPRELVTHGPILRVHIGFDPNYTPNKDTPPVPGLSDVEALVDTGAEQCCIDIQVAARLQLPLIDRCRTIGVHGSEEVDMYLAQVHVPMLLLTIQGAFAGLPLEASGLPFQALMGRTFLTVRQHDVRGNERCRPY